MKKFIGFVLLILGVIAYALTFDLVKNTVNITMPAALTTTYLTIIGIVLVIIGIILLAGKGKGSGKQSAEVPIYQNNRVVGYRRV